MAGPGPRSVAKDVVISFGTSSTRGKLYPIVRGDLAKEETTFLLCPDCGDANPTRVVQKYHGSVCGHMGPLDANNVPGWTPRDMPLRGKAAADGTTVVLDTDEIKAAKEADGTANLIELNVHPADQVAQQTWTGEKAYAFIPDRADNFYAVLRDTAAEPDIAWVGTLTMRSNNKMYRIIPGFGTIVFQELVRPEELWHFDKVDASYSERDLKFHLAMVQAMTEDFEASDYRKESRDRFAALVASKTGVDLAQPIEQVLRNAKPAKLDEVSDDQFDALLAASVAAAAAKKAAKQAARSESA